MFFTQLESICKENGTTPSTVSRKLGFSMGSVSHWRKGATPSGDKVVPFADYFGVTTDFFLRGDSPSSNSINNDISGTGVAGNIYGGTVQGLNSGSVTIHNGLPQPVSDELAELIRIYNNIDVKKRIKLLEAAFSLEESREEQ